MSCTRKLNQVPKRRHYKSWKPWEDKYIINHYLKIPSWEIAKNLGRTTAAVRTRVRRSSLFSAAKLTRGSGCSFKRAIPAEKWPIVTRFLARLDKYSAIAEKHGKSFDVTVFIDEYRKIYIGEEW